MSVSSIGPTTQIPPVSQKAVAPAENAATEAADKSSTKPEEAATQTSSRNTPNPALKVNSDGTVGPHHKPRHPHPTTQSAVSTAQTPQQPETLPGSIKV
jgi:hypothetical protein